MGGYGYKQETPASLTSTPASPQSGGNIDAVKSGAEALLNGGGATAATGTVTATDLGATIGVGAGTEASVEGAAALAGLFFYGGETVSQIKSSFAHKVNVIGGLDGLKSNEDKTFYSNVHIPRKKI